MFCELTSAASIHLVVDGATDVNSSSVINVIGCTPKPYFLESFYTGSATKSGAYMADLIKPLIEKIGASKVASLITDNASSMDTFFDRLKEYFPHIFSYHCAAHTFNLLIKDIVNDVKDMKSPNLIMAKVYKIVREITGSTKKKAIYKAKKIASSTSGKESCNLRLFSLTR